MIKIEKTEVYGWEAAVRGMRNPLNSWEKSDSMVCRGADGFEDCKANVKGVCPRHEDFSHDIFCVGENDHDLMMRLAKAGRDHAKYRRMIVVSFDVTAPLYWWKEFDTYKVGTVANSCSTMHKIHAKDFAFDDFSHDHLDAYGTTVLHVVTDALNTFRKRFNETKDKTYWYRMIELLPSSYNQRRTIMLNYEVLAGMYKARRNHKLDEWVDFCTWVESLPYSEIITGAREEE